MLKVLIMMAYFREAELDPSVFQKQLVYSSHTHDEVGSVQFSQPTSLVVGQSYSIETLVNTMIKDSDNGAEQLLLDNVDIKVLDQAYVDLGVPSPDSVPGDYTISTAQYAAFLRILYNSTYLIEKFSESALAIMTESTYKDGISAGVPKDIVVAQKYGERVDTDIGGAVVAVELHDCGIVYVPEHPYELCVMTKGRDEKKLASVIQGISSLVYKEVTGTK
jgi:hypothetical protein